MAHRREEAALGAIGGLGLIARGAQALLGLGTRRDVAADALDFAGAGNVVAQRDIAPGNPARAVGARDALIMHACAVGQRRDRTLRDRRKRVVGADQDVGRAAGEAPKASLA